MAQSFEPLALQIVDETLGSEAVRAYNQAVTLAPHLGGLAVILEQQMTAFQHSPLGLGGSYVLATTRYDYYRRFIESGWSSQRFPKIMAFLQLGISPLLCPR